MATELPLFHKAHVPGEHTANGNGLVHSSLLTQEPTLQDDAFLQELLGTNGNDLLSSLLEATDNNTATDPPLNFDFDINPLLNLPTSPMGSDISVSETSHTGFLNRANSPGSLTSVSDTIGDSPANSPHNLATFSNIQQPYHSLLGVSDPTLSSFMVSSGMEMSESPTALSPDVRIDVDVMATSRASASPSSTTDLTEGHEWYEEEASPSGGSSDRKAHTLFLTEDEKKLLAEEGITLPTDMPLTKAEQKHLKRVRRKIKNKISAQESRKRKKVYVDGLEDRVKICTERNRELKKEVDCLKHDNVSLMSQLKKLQALVAQYNPSRIQAGSVLLVIVLSFSMFFVPKLKHPGGGGLGQMRGFSRSSRTLLFAETDEFGNVIDPDSGLIISRAGGQSPNFPPPWIHQTPSPTLFSLRTKIFPSNYMYQLLKTENYVDTSSSMTKDDKDIASDSIDSVNAHTIQNDNINSDKASRNNSLSPEGDEEQEGDTEEL